MVPSPRAARSGYRRWNSPNVRSFWPLGGPVLHRALSRPLSKSQIERFVVRDVHQAWVFAARPVNRLSGKAPVHSRRHHRFLRSVNGAGDPAANNQNPLLGRVLVTGKQIPSWRSDEPSARAFLVVAPYQGRLAAFGPYSAAPAFEPRDAGLIWSH